MNMRRQPLAASQLRDAALRDDAQDLVEYALLIALISLALVGSVRAFSTLLGTLSVWDAIGNLV
jgi:Flp pilus assembly pilin Flp